MIIPINETDNRSAVIFISTRITILNNTTVTGRQITTNAMVLLLLLYSHITMESYPLETFIPTLALILHFG